ncbi:LysM peptidoglycan-binding domain-containing protein [Bowdeniella nasicola]|nr:LysM peptidoglycan-binding domain-containing protein [Bowdeniella nasicola]
MNRHIGSSLLVLAVGSSLAVFLARVATGLIASLISVPVVHVDLVYDGIGAVLLVLGAALAAWYAASGALALAVQCGRIEASAIIGYLAPLTSRLVRRAAAASLTVGLGASLPLSGAMAQNLDTPIQVATSDVLPPVPTTPPAAPAPEAPAPAAPVASESDTYTVQRGDCLWRIAEHQLGTQTNAATAHAVSEIVELNPDIIDPDLIYPNQTLTLPKDLP